MALYSENYILILKHNGHTIASPKNIYETTASILALNSIALTHNRDLFYYTKDNWKLAASILIFITFMPTIYLLLCFELFAKKS